MTTENHTTVVDWDSNYPPTEQPRPGALRIGAPSPDDSLPRWRQWWEASRSVLTAVSLLIACVLVPMLPPPSACRDGVSRTNYDLTPLQAKSSKDAKVCVTEMERRFSRLPAQPLRILGCYNTGLEAEAALKVLQQERSVREKQQNEACLVAIRNPGAQLSDFWLRQVPGFLSSLVH